MFTAQQRWVEESEEYFFTHAHFKKLTVTVTSVQWSACWSVFLAWLLNEQTVSIKEGNWEFNSNLDFITIYISVYVCAFLFLNSICAKRQNDIPCS